MTDYWKSQDRKYCEFCKCWFADNKVSISFHENGKRHKENVKKHISQLTKKSAKDYKQKEKIDEEMKKMEAAAMAAYLKDVQNNADLTSQSINEMLGHKIETNAPEKKIEKEDKVCKVVWHEVKSDDGNSYYWNTETNETAWEPPENFLSLLEQAKKLEKEQQKEKKRNKEKKEKQKEVNKEMEANAMRDRMRELAAPAEPAKTAWYGPAPRPSAPYGKWTPVVERPETKIDLQLPKSKEVEPPPIVVEPEVIQFKEKRVESLGDGPVEFKKRKFNSKKHMRQKLDDD